MQVKGPIAVDAMGGDGAPQTIVRGALESVTDSGISVCLVGPQKRLRRELGRFRFLPSGLELVDAPDVVGMNISVLRGKKHSSLNVCAELVREGRATAMVTAGNTGAAWVAAKAALGMIDGVDRPALAWCPRKRVIPWSSMSAPTWSASQTSSCSSPSWARSTRRRCSVWIRRRWA